MKIRLGFITNSSGGSFTHIKIENEELCKILKKYIDEMKKVTNKKIYHPNIKDNQIIDVGKSGDAGDKEIFWERNIEEIFSNYYLYQDTHNEKNTNEKLSKDTKNNVYVKLLSLEEKRYKKTLPAAFTQAMEPSIKKLKNEAINQIFDEMKKEIKEKSELINNSYGKISINDSFSGYGESYFDTTDDESYEPDIKCPICSSPLIYKYKEHRDHRIPLNNKKEELLKCSNSKCNFSAYNKIL